MKKLPQQMRGAKNVPYVKISLGRKELNALMNALDQNKTVLDGSLEDSVIHLQTHILNKGRYKPENEKKKHDEVVSLELWGDDITLMLQQFVATSLSQVVQDEEVSDFFETIKNEYLEKNPKKNSKEEK
ncbi:MAG: hypothetical protein R3Y63_11220 [Eubacteriales bacterium]